MKALSIFLLICCIIGAIIFVEDKSLPQQINQFIYYSACNYPQTYALGTIDPQFQISRDKFATDIQQATDIWSNAEGKRLFMYDPNAQFHINLIYDQRQYLDSKINQLKTQVDANNNTLKLQIAEYKKATQDFKNRLQQLNSQIDTWNKQGGAPQDVYDALVTQQKQLKQEGEQLNAKAQSLNLSTEEYNTKVGLLNQTVTSFNNTLTQKPEEGIYDPQHNRINIYFDVNQDEFIHTIAHEFGHALGLEHNLNPNSIMYPYTTKSIILTPNDRAALTEACRTHSLLERFETNLTYILASFNRSSK